MRAAVCVTFWLFHGVFLPCEVLFSFHDVYAVQRELWLRILQRCRGLPSLAITLTPDVYGYASHGSGCCSGVQQNPLK